MDRMVLLLASSDLPDPDFGGPRVSLARRYLERATEIIYEMHIGTFTTGEETGKRLVNPRFSLPPSGTHKCKLTNRREMEKVAELL